MGSIMTVDCTRCGARTVLYEGSEYSHVCPPGSATSPPSGGLKFDNGKAPLTWIPMEALQAEAQVFRFGGNKYGRNNYKKGMQWTRLLDAALRHIYAYANGEDKDPESGISHLAHARCSLAMVLLYEAHKLGEDDRKEGT